jgi:hypothetical protein
VKPGKDVIWPGWWASSVPSVERGRTCDDQVGATTSPAQIRQRDRPCCPTTGDPAALIATVRRSLASVDPGWRFDVAAMPQRVSVRSNGVERRCCWPPCLRSSLLLASVGIYGVSPAVSQRARVGIRMALGSDATK